MNKKLTYLPIGILTLTTAFSGVALTSANVIAETTGSKTATVTVPTSCTFTTAASYSTALTVYAGSTADTTSNTSKAMNQVSCNDPAGFKITALGFSPDATHAEGLDGNNTLYDSVSGNTIATGTSGDNSFWAFKVGAAYGTSTVTVATGYGDFSEVPGGETPVDIITYGGTSAGSVTGLFRTDYQVHASSMQPGGSYTGAVKYAIAPAV